MEPHSLARCFYFFLEFVACCISVVLSRPHLAQQQRTIGCGFETPDLCNLSSEFCPITYNCSALGSTNVTTHWFFSAATFYERQHTHRSCWWVPTSSLGLLDLPSFGLNWQSASNTKIPRVLAWLPLLLLGWKVIFEWQAFFFLSVFLDHNQQTCPSTACFIFLLTILHFSVAGCFLQKFLKFPTFFHQGQFSPIAF